MTSRSENKLAKRLLRESAYLTDEEFSRSLLSDDDLTAVLRAHLIIESHFNKFFRSFFPHAHYIDGLTVTAKINIARAIGVPDPILQAIDSVNKLRNDFAHTIGFSIDDAALKLAFPWLQGEIIENLMAEMHLATPSHRLRFYLSWCRATAKVLDQEQTAYQLGRYEKYLEKERERHPPLPTHKGLTSALLAYYGMALEPLEPFLRRIRPDLFDDGSTAVSGFALGESNNLDPEPH